MSNPQLSEEDVLLAFSTEPSHDMRTLEQYLRLYPQFTRALIDCSLELELSQSTSKQIERTDVEVANKSWERFQALVGTSAVADANPFARLDSAKFRALATTLDMNALLLMRLRDRAIRFSTIPAELVRRLSHQLGVTADVLSLYLRGAPTLAANLRLKSEEKPAATRQIDFSDAVRSSHLSDAQQQTLLALKD